MSNNKFENPFNLFENLLTLFSLKIKFILTLKYV